MSSDSLAQSLVDAAAEAARAEFFGAVLGYVGKVDGAEVTFNPEDLVLVTDKADMWVRVARAALEKATLAHADHLMATAAELYRVSREIREG